MLSLNTNLNCKWVFDMGQHIQQFIVADEVQSRKGKPLCFQVILWREKTAYQHITTM